ncbi:type IV pilus modification protein PilV [Comamonas aquatica]|uniref:type IV pilus modification protein PilV n=1 Tax=Comamonas aquatica TaxID=225991 RepID=UPI001B381AE9|nr:type IV pilus modification protein PilV [Comamonas aquatica]QTX20111.1 type IV pilus modification protein PilV [Comamonas aquatica]
MLTISIVRRTPADCTGAREYGFIMIEVLVTLVILLIGLLGVFGMQIKASKVELESYQRAQAISLVRDMANKLAQSREQIADYLTDDASSTDGKLYVGVMASGVTDPCLVTATAAKTELCKWGQLLKGSAAQEGTNAVGAMIGARGCLIRVEPAQLGAVADIFVVVVWQGLVPSNDPLPDALTGQKNCASGIDFGSGLRRGISLRVMIPDLKKDT